MPRQLGISSSSCLQHYNMMGENGKETPRGTDFDP